MCLATVLYTMTPKERRAAPKKRQPWRRYYKVFEVVALQDRRWIAFPVKYSTPVHCNRSMATLPYRLIAGDGRWYQMGFHVFRRRKDAEEWGDRWENSGYRAWIAVHKCGTVVIPVLGRLVVAKGEHYGLPVHVVASLKIRREVAVGALGLMTSGDQERFVSVK